MGSGREQNIGSTGDLQDPGISPGRCVIGSADHCDNKRRYYRRDGAIVHFRKMLVSRRLSQSGGRYLSVLDIVTSSP
jgi:hypothetical protein